MRLCLPLAVASALILSGCATRGVLTADVPVAVACVKEVPARPPLMADEVWAKSTDPFERARALLVDRLRLLMHAERLEALLQACKESS
jgi:uncharacterized protein YceK